MSNPFLNALVICDTVLQDRESGKFTLVGLFSRLAAFRFPVIHPEMGIYACLSDCSGPYDLTLEVTNVSTGKAVGRVSGIKVVATSRLEPIQFSVKLKGLRFDQPGRHEVVVRSADHFIGSRIFEVVRLEAPNAAGQPGD